MPGQSIAETRQKEWGRLDEPLSMVLCLWVLVLYEWAAQMVNTPRGPLPLLIVAILGTARVIPKILVHRRKDADFRLGRAGELAVAEVLETLRAQGFRPLHDVVAGNFNIDHVLIGPPGIFAIETKTRRKAGGRDEKIQVEGSRILLGGKPVEPNPVEQAKANAAWVREFLARSTGRQFKVEPVLIFPGWWVEFTQKPNGLFVMNEKGLENIIAKLSPTLNQEDVAMASLHLEQFVRASSLNTVTKS